MKLKKFTAAAIAATMMVSAFTVMADNDETITYADEFKDTAYGTVYAKDYTTENPYDLPISEMYNGEAGTLPAGWMVADVDESKGEYIKISNENFNSNASYLRINGANRDAASVKADRMFNVPEGGELINISFDHTSNLNGYGKQIVFMNDDTVALKMTHDWVTNNNYVRVNNQNLCVENASWRHYDITVNCSDTIIGEFEPGQYKITYNKGSAGESTLTGYLSNNLKTINKIRFESATWIASVIGIDNLSISVAPKPLKITNQVQVKCGDEEVTQPTQFGSEMNIESKLFNESSTDNANAIVVAALYKNGYMINASASKAENIPYPETDGEEVFGKADITLNTPAEDIFGDMSLSVFTLNAYDTIGALCQKYIIGENSDDAEFVEETSEPTIDETTNILTYGGVAKPEKEMTYAVLKSGKTLSSEMSADDFCNALYYFGETTSDEDGKYAFNVKFAGMDSDYTLIVNDGGEKLKQYPLTFTNKIADGIIEEIGTVDNIDDFKIKLDAYLEAVCYNDALYNSNINGIKSSETFYNMLFNDIKNNPISNSDEFLKLVQNATVMYVLGNTTEKNDFVNVLSENINMLDITKSYADELYSDGALTDDTVKAVVFDNLASIALKDNTVLTDFDKFFEAMGDSTVLAVCEKAVGAGTGKRVIEILNNHIGDNDSDFASSYNTYTRLASKKSDNVALKIMNVKYNGIDELKDSFKKAVKEADTTTSSNSTGGGTTVRPSSSSSSGGGGSAVIPYTPSTVKEPELVVPVYKIPSKSNEEIEYSDIDDAGWAKDYVISLSQRGIIAGDNGNFYPNKPILREEFVKMLVKTFSFETLYVGSNFSDVPTDSWYYEYVSAAHTNGIINGKDNNKFGAGEYITREDICVMLCRALEKYGVYMPKNETEAFTDDSNLSSYARENVYMMKKLGVIGGFPNGDFAPKKNSTRAETAKMLNTVIDYLLDEMGGE